MSLTDTHIRSLKATDKEQEHFDGGGLYLSIPKTGRKLWRMACRRHPAALTTRFKASFFLGYSFSPPPSKGNFPYYRGIYVSFQGGS